MTSQRPGGTRGTLGERGWQPAGRGWHGGRVKAPRGPTRRHLPGRSKVIVAAVAGDDFHLDAWAGTYTVCMVRLDPTDKLAG